MDLKIPDIFEVEYRELIDRGLNEKMANIHIPIEKLLREIITERLRSLNTSVKFPIWHFKSIKYSTPTKKYYIEVGNGHATTKG